MEASLRLFCDLVLDSCAGSGTILLAAKKLGRNYIGFEREKEYFDIAKERICGLWTHTHLRGGSFFEHSYADFLRYLIATATGDSFKKIEKNKHRTPFDYNFK